MPFFVHLRVGSNGGAVAGHRVARGSGCACRGDYRRIGTGGFAPRPRQRATVHLPLPRQPHLDRGHGWRSSDQHHHRRRPSGPALRTYRYPRAGIGRADWTPFCHQQRGGGARGAALDPLCRRRQPGHGGATACPWGTGFPSVLAVGYRCGTRQALCHRRHVHDRL